MSDLERDVREEDEVRRLVSLPERGLETPPFAALRTPNGTTVHGLVPRSALVLVVVVLLVVAISPFALRALPGVPGNPQPSPTLVAQSAQPVAVPPGQGVISVTPCAAVPMPSYVPRASSVSSSTETGASSQDVVSLTMRDLSVGGLPAVLTITSQSAAGVVWWGGTPPPLTHTGQRDVQVTTIDARASTITGPGMPTPRPNGPTTFTPRTDAVAQWTEPDAACPYFTAMLWSSGTDAAALQAELLKILASMAPAPRAAATWVPVILSSEADAWARIRAQFQTGPVAMPTWLPPQVDRSHVEIRKLGITPTREYEVVYRDSAGTELLTFRLGPVNKVGGSGIGFCCVRGARASLSFDTSLFTDATKPGARQLQWQEQTRTLSIRSDRISGDDLIHIGFELDRTTAPGNPYPNVRATPGACAATSSATDTVIRLLALAGSNDRASVLDCYAIDPIMVDGPDGPASWAGLPPTKNVQVVKPFTFGGRSVVGATWDFASDPGGAWGPRATRFFLVGLEDGRWRIYEVDSAFPGNVP